MLISRISPEDYDAPGAGTAAPRAEVVRITESAARADGRSPLDEAASLELRHRGLDGKALWLAVREDGGTPVGFALAQPAPEAAGTVDGSHPDDASAVAVHVAVHVVVAPEERGRGAGRALTETVLEAYPGTGLAAWSHGNHPAAGRLADAHGFVRDRDLWVMRRPLGPEHPLPDPEPAGGVVVRRFVPGRDEDAWLALNAEAFADHPEQGALSRADLDERMAEPWFDPAGFFLAEPADAPHDPEANEAVESPSLLGFHWTKVHATDPPHGEVYVLGVSPAAQGRGLGRLLTLTGLQHLAGLGLKEVVLFVEADNAPAVAVYAGLGFTHADADTDVLWRRPGAQRPGG